MTDTANISNSHAVTLGGRKSSFQVASEARMRAAVTRGKDDAELHSALARLDRVLGSGKPLRFDVPPGYYINVRV